MVLKPNILKPNFSPRYKVYKHSLLFILLMIKHGNFEIAVILLYSMKLSPRVMVARPNQMSSCALVRGL